MPNYFRYILIILGSSLLFLPFLGSVHLFDWDEINFAECAREMLVSGDYLRAQIDFMPFWEKPPLFIWMQVLAMKGLGVGEYAARLPNALTGIATLATLFYVGKRVVHEKMGMWWAVLYAACWLPQFYFRTGIIDPVFNLFIFLAFFQVHLIRFSQRQLLHSVLAGLFLGLAVLTKGPAAILIALLALVVYAVVSRGLPGIRWWHLGVVALFAALPVLAWFGAAVLRYSATYGQWFLVEFIRYQARLFSTEDADHGGPFVYHFIVLLAGCFPASIFLFQYTGRRVTSGAPSHYFTRWMWVLFWVVLLLFSIVKTKIVHYSSLCYFPLTFLGALQLYRLSTGEIKLKPLVTVMMVVVGSIVALAVALLPVVGMYKQALVPYIQDPFAVANLSANVSWSYADCIWGVGYLAAIWVAVRMMRIDFRKGMLVLCVAQVVAIQATVLIFTPRIEAYTQRSAIDFYKSFAGKDVYVHPLGYKSYANLFYARKTPSNSPDYGIVRPSADTTEKQLIPNEAWLLYGTVDRPTYFICKVMDAPRYRELPQLQEIGGSNGFVFFRRR